MLQFTHKWLIGLILIGLSSFTQAASDEVSIQSLIDQYQNALNASDAKIILTFYDKAPVFMPQHAPAQVGRKAVQQAYENVFNNIKLDIRFTTHSLEVLGDTAWARTSSAGKTKILANDAIINEGNNELFIFKKQQGEWKIHQYLFSTNQPRNSVIPPLQNYPLRP